MSGNLWRKIATDVTINRHKGRSYRQSMPLKLAKKRKTAITLVAASDLRALGFIPNRSPSPPLIPPKAGLRKTRAQMDSRLPPDLIGGLSGSLSFAPIPVYRPALQKNNQPS